MSIGRKTGTSEFWNDCREGEAMRRKPFMVLRVLGKTVHVFKVPPTHRGLKDSPKDKDPGLGRYQEGSLDIYIAQGQVLDQEIDTLSHELFHGIDDLTDIGLTEEQVVKLTTGWLAALRDNPKLVEYLLRSR